MNINTSNKYILLKNTITDRKNQKQGHIINIMNKRDEKN